MNVSRAPRARPAMVAFLIALVAVATIWALSARGASNRAQVSGPVMLFTSLPLIWGEAGSLGEILNAKQPPHWFRTGLESKFGLVALDTLDGPVAAANLAASDTLIIAQPRPLGPSENVALDDWVRAGGRLLLFADPALTWDSAFAIGDRRRPMDTVMLSPILGRWSLELRFDETQPAGERLIELGGGDELFVNLPGQLVRRAGGQGDCKIVAEVLAECTVGKGHVLIAADAALLEPAQDAEEAKLRQTLLDELLARL